MRSRPEHIVENLRLAAEMEAEDFPDQPIQESPLTEAADLIEWLMDALTEIKDGAAEPVRVATDALGVQKWRDAGPPELPPPLLSAEDEEALLITTEQLLARLRR